MRNIFDFKLDKYDKFLYGFIGGIVLGVAIAAFQILLFLVVTNTFLSIMIFLKIFRLTSHQVSSSSSEFHGCPECGSTRRHKKDCSRGKK